MNSWWELGEGSGFSGNKMEVWRLTCPFCNEKGNFELAYHAEKKKPNSGKRLNFDLYECLNCTGFVHVLWSAAEFSQSLYSYQVLPWPVKGKPEPSENWPCGMTRFWIQAHDTLTNENWDAANVMARSALQFIVRDKGAVGGNLSAQINDLVTKGILHPLMKDWATEVRLLANESAHPEAPMPADMTPQDVRDIVHFLDLLLFYLYDLPKQIENYRLRKNPATPSP
jgi:Domain of unknown function (DUF4145)